MTVGIWKAQVQIFGNTLNNFSLLTFFSAFPLAEKSKEKKTNFHYFTMIFNRKASNSSPVIPPHSSLLHIHSALVSTIDNATNIAWNSSLFWLTEFTPDLDLKAVQWKKSFMYSPLSRNPNRILHESCNNPPLVLHWFLPSSISQNTITTTSSSAWYPVTIPMALAIMLPSVSWAYWPSSECPTWCFCPISGSKT